MAAAFGLLLYSAATHAQRSWTTGVEREVDEGVYMQVFASQNGWRVWRTETRDGVDCRAVKSARGRPHPSPVGVGSALYGGTPYLGVYNGYDGKLTYSWFAEHYGRVKVKVRQPGDKFWDELPSTRADMSPYGEGTIQVNLTSWEYPEILVGYSEEEAIFELVGIGWAIESLGKCNAS